MASVSGVDIARQFRLGADGTQDPGVISHLVDQAAAARTAEAAGQEVQTFPLFPGTVEEARKLGGEHGAEGFAYYCTPRARHPRSAQFLPWSSVDRIVGFDAFAFADLIAPRPLLLIAGRAAVTSWMAVETFQRAREPKELHWIDGASHVDLYDKEEYVGPAVAKLAGFYAASLAAASLAAAAVAVG